MSEEYENPKGGELRYEGDGPNLRYDEFVQRIVRDPKDPPQVTLLSGYLGSSSEKEHVRLYLDEELSRYVEIPENAIRYTQALPPEQSPLGGSLVWIDSGAEVLHGAAGSERRKATFLEGQIAQDYMGGGGSITTQTRECLAPMPTVSGVNCGQSQFSPCIPQTEVQTCRTKTGIVCTHIGTNCRTVLVNQCQSVSSPCFTQNKLDCVASGFVGCNPPVDFTIRQEQFSPQQFEAQAFGGGGTQAKLCQTQNPQCYQTMELCASQSVRCPSAVDACPTRFNCPSQHTPCQSQLVRCPSALDECPTRFNCPSMSAPCATQDFSCATKGACPSAVDACPTRFGCFGGGF